MASSRGEAKEAYLGMHLDTALKLPIKERIDMHVFGGETEARAETLCVFGDRVPAHQSHPRIITFRGQMKVFDGDKLMLFSRSRSKIRYQLDRISSNVLPPMNMSSC